MSKCLKKFEYTRIYCEVDHNELDMMGEAGWERVNQLSIHDLNYWHTLWSVIFTFFR